jgi:hypothetical protein
MRLPLAFTLISLSLAACGGDDSTTMPDAPAAKDVGFNPPTMTLQANMDGSDGWTTIGPADLSCLNTPSTDMPTTVAVALATTVKDFQNQTPVGSATVTAFKDIDIANVFDTQTSDSQSGAVTITIPTGTTRFGFKMTADTAMPTFLLNQKVDPDMATQTLGEIQSVSSSTATLLPALIGQTRTAGTGVAAGALRDCQSHEISNFVVTISSTSGTATPIDGAEAFYFSESPELPAQHHTAESASRNGLFMLIQVPAAPTAYVQAWGFPTDADLQSGQMKLISELAVPVVADTVITGSFEPLRQ